MLLASSGRQVGADDTIAPCGPLFRRAREAVKAVGDPQIDEARITKHRNQLCFQQSAGDSTRPQINVLARVLRQIFGKHDVGYLGTAARSEHTMNLGHRVEFVRHKVQHAIGQHHIHAA